jgi:hypothetical protein
MELNLTRQAVTVSEVIFDGALEQAIECDALLPDYCPDIVKILKCAVSTQIGSAAVSGSHLTIEGMLTAHIYYAADNGGIRHTEYKIPFAKTAELRSAPSFPVVTVKPSVDYVNCRAVNQRRVDVRGAVTLAVKVTEAKERQVISDADGAGLELRREMVRATDLSGRHDTTFTVTENLELGYCKPPVNTILRTDCRVKTGEHKVVAGKVVVKAELLLHVCYQAQDAENKLEVMDYTLPLSQIIDADRTDEDSVVSVELHVTACDVQPKQDGDGEYRLLALDARVGASVAAYRHKEIPVASDCYSTRFESSCKHRPAAFQRLVSAINETVLHKTSLELPEGIDSVIDAWCEVEELTWKQEGDSIIVAMKLTVSMFARMQDGDCLYFEQPTQCEHRITVNGSCPGLQFEPSADVLSSAYNLTGGDKIDVRCEISLWGCVFCTVSVQGLDEITVDESQPKAKEKNKLYLYYAEPGESIWSIAKRYNTSAAAIWEENAATEDALAERAMLMIPIV